MSAVNVGYSLGSRAVVGMLAFMACAAPGCSRIVFEWQGPSDGFRGADLDGDGAIDQEEREWLYEAYRDRLFYFRSYDCDRDGRISWHEHFQYRFKNRTCLGSPVREPPVTPEVQRASPLLTSAYGVVVRTPVSLMVEREPRSHPPRRRHPYSESDPRPDQAAAVTIKTELLERVVLPLPRSPYFGPPAQQPESVQRLRCVVANPTGDFRITLVDLDIEWTPAADASATMRRGYLKTASIEPQGSAAFLAWFPTELREARCILRGVRGQPAD